MRCLLRSTSDTLSSLADALFSTVAGPKRWQKRTTGLTRLESFRSGGPVAVWRAFAGLSLDFILDCALHVRATCLAWLAGGFTS